MKSFREFIFICEEKQGRSGPKYNYEVALVNLYNHLIKGTDKANNKGKILRGLVSRGDTEELTDFLAQELNSAKNDESHPLHFNNADDEGFTGGKKTDAHRDSYYGELEDQFYTFLNDSQSKLGKSLISQGYTVKRLGDDKIPLSKSGKSAYGKESDTSKADIVFQHPTRPERTNYTSLKKASGALSASAGSKESAGNYTIGMKNALKLALKSGRITKEEAKKLEAEGNTKISSLKDVMASSKGMSKEQQKDLQPQIDKLLGDIEGIVSGTARETAKTQLSGAGKYDKPVQSYVSTGRGGGRKKKPEEVSGTNQRSALGKGSQKTAEGGQREMTTRGDIKAPKTGEPSSFASFSKQASEAQKALADAEREQADASVIKYPDGTPVPRKNQYYLQNNPDAAQQHAARQQAAAQAVQQAQTTIADIETRAAQAREKSKPQPEAPRPQQSQQPQRTEPVDTKPQQPVEKTPEQPIPQSQPETPEQKKRKRERTEAERSDMRRRMDSAGQAQGLPEYA
jgi:hypothetical protein